MTTTMALIFAFVVATIVSPWLPIHRGTARTCTQVARAVQSHIHKAQSIDTHTHTHLSIWERALEWSAGVEQRGADPPYSFNRHYPDIHPFNCFTPSIDE